MKKMISYIKITLIKLKFLIKIISKKRKADWIKLKIKNRFNWIGIIDGWMNIKDIIKA